MKRPRLRRPAHLSCGLRAPGVVGDTSSVPSGAHRVVFDGRYIQDRYHGIGRYAFHLVQELAHMLPGTGITLLRDPGASETRFNWDLRVDLPNIEVEAARAPVFSLREQWVMPGALRGARSGHRTALYHTPYFALPWLPSFVPSIVTVHDCIFERDPRYMPRRWARLYYRLLMKASLARSRYVAVPSRSTARDLRRFYRVPAHKIVVTPEAADSTFRPVDDSKGAARLMSKYTLPESFVLAVGMRRPHKNFATLVRAVERVEGAHLVFVGGADERFEDEAASAAAGLKDRVHFIGKVPEEDLPLMYNLATVVASPSRIEGFGLPVLEAMACGTPLVCSDIAVFKEVAGDAALGVPSDDVGAWAEALGALLASPGLRADLRRKGLERARSFTWAQAAEALVPAYSSLDIRF